MALHPVNDRLKVKVDIDPAAQYNLVSSEESKGTETGIVVEVPDMLIYLSFHSFAFEYSFMAEEDLKAIQNYYKTFLNKRIYWEAFQDRGRRIKEGADEYIYLQMTDLLAYSDDDNDNAKLVEDTRTGSFAV